MLTLDLYDKIIDAVHEKSKNHLKMLGHVTRDECAEYLGFYAFHNGLYWSEQDGKIVGVSTAHPGKRDFDWKWSNPEGIWMAHLVWADNVKAHAEVLRKFLKQQDQPVHELWAWIDGKPVALTAKKLERIFSYGRRRIISANASTSTSVQ